MKQQSFSASDGEFAANGATRLGTYSREHLGDALCTSPLPRMLWEQTGRGAYVPDHPTARAVFRQNPYVSGYLPGGAPLCRLARGHGHVIQRIVQALELPLPTRPRPEIYLSPDERRWARRVRRELAGRRRMCILSTGAMTDAGNLARVDWSAAAGALGRRHVVVQPVVREPVARGATALRGLTLRRYMALIAEADLFVGGTSGGSHVAAAFDVPAIIVVWRELHREARFPVAAGGEAGELRFKASFLYPHHALLCAEDLERGTFREDTIRSAIENAARRQQSANAGEGAGPCAILPRPPSRITRTAAGRLALMPGVYGERWSA